MFKYNINGDCEHFDNTSMAPQGKKTAVSTLPQGSTNQDSTYSTLADMSSTLGNISSTLGNMSSTLGNMAKSKQPIQQTSNDMLGNTEKDNIIKRLLILNYKKNNNQSNIDETKIVNEMWQKISQSEKNRIKQMTVDELNNILKPNNMLGNTEKDNIIKRLLILNYKKNNNQSNIDETKIVNEIWQEMSQSKKDNIRQMSMDELNNMLKSFNVF
jgi:DNA-binding IscR family transcriptional regulator